MKELLASIALLVLLILFLNPFDLWMPTALHMMVLGGVVAAFGVVAVFMLRERAEDERAEAHRSFAGRAAFLAGAFTLVLAIVVQSFNHSVDPWLVGGLAVMIAAKMAARAYSDRHL